MEAINERPDYHPGKSKECFPLYRAISKTSGQQKTQGYQATLSIITVVNTVK